MARRRFFIDEVRHSRAVLAGEDARHLTKVLRVEIGQRFELSDNRSVYLAEIESFRKDEVWFRIEEKLPAEEPPVRLHLFAALVKFDRFEWMLEKATELGVERIAPVAAERSEKGLDQAAGKRLERWRKIVRESSQQARRAHLPEVTPPVPFRAAVQAPVGFACFLDESPDAPRILRSLPAVEMRSPSDTVSVLIGPEGGWTDHERDAAKQAGWVPVSLGRTILRAETAAVAALAVLSNAWLS